MSETSETPVLIVNPCPLCKSGHAETWSYNRDCSMHGAAGGVKCKVCGHSVKVKGDDRDDTGRSCLNAAIMQWNDQAKYAPVGGVAALCKALESVIRSMEQEARYMCTEEKKLGTYDQSQEDLCKGCRARDCECWPMTIKRECEEALAQPRKNYEVGTPEEQAKRFDSFCVSHYTPPNKDGVVPDGCDCPCYVRGKGKGCNVFVWGQLPYVEKEGGAK